MFFAGAVTLPLTLILLAITGRLAFSVVTVAVTVVILHLISWFKIKLVDEPLTFADFALLRHAVRHPRLYYANFLWSPPGIAAIVFTLALIAGWLWLEPPLAVTNNLFARVVLLLIAAAILAVALIPLRIATIDDLLARAAPQPNLEADIGRLGLVGSLAAHLMRWRRAMPVPLQAEPLAVHAGAPEVVVIIQIESFADPRSWGGDAVAMPNLASAQERAAIAGMIAPLGHGAYTMRPEFEILTGISIDDVGFDRFNPYLRAERFAAAALPNRLGAAGYETIFIHPHDREFFRRHRVMPAFGFKRLIDDNDFAATDFAGRYVGDVGLGRRIMAEIKAASSPAFVFAVTMENHGPWTGALGTTPAQQYAAGLQNSDRMIGDLVAALDDLGRRALLMFYGDHAPIMKGITGRVPTPFAVLTWPPVDRRERSSEAYGPAALHAELLKLMTGRF